VRLDIALLKILFPAVFFTSHGEGICLTFDDGPHPQATPMILDILKKYKVIATFFLLGEKVRAYPDICRSIIDEGHQIGNHSYFHENLFFKGRKTIENSILKTRNIIRDAAGTDTEFFRPPYGFINPAVLGASTNTGHKCVLWSVDSRDYIQANQKKIAGIVPQKVEKGSILLFHDNDATSGAIGIYLPSLIEIFADKGLRFGKISI
jgi:peptidoglycan-N-acetylglucosamine deacetylase